MQDFTKLKEKNDLNLNKKEKKKFSVLVCEIVFKLFILVVILGALI